MRILLWLVLTGVSHAYSSFRNTWINTYDTINNEAVSCRLCHKGQSGGSPWNAYGWNIRQELNSNGYNIVEAFLAVEELDSDKDGTTNIQEINSDTMPGWTAGLNNTFYSYSTIVENQAPLVSEDLVLDPVLDTYKAWVQSLYPTQINEEKMAAEADFNNDGVSNLTAFYFGLSPAVAIETSVPEMTFNTEGVVITYARNSNIAEGKLILEHTSSLVQWTEMLTDNDGVSLEIVPNGVSKGIDKVVYTLDKEMSEKRFFTRFTINP